MSRPLVLFSPRWWRLLWLIVKTRKERGPLPGRDFMTGDDPVTCRLCGKITSVAMIAHHLVTEHGIDPDDIANALIVDHTEEEESP